MYGKKFKYEIRECSCRIYDSLQIWRGRIKIVRIGA